MQFAVNWSPEAAALVDEGRIDVDLFKCPDWTHVVAAAQAQRPAYIHFPLQIGTTQQHTWDFSIIEGWLKQTDTRFVNCHITPDTSALPHDITHDDLVPILTTQVQRLVDAFGAERVIIENCPYFAGNVDQGYMKHSTDPRLFHEIIDTTGCGFLLDMAHVALVCDFLGWSFEQTICALPTTHIREFHITGIGQWTTGITGDHMPMTDDDWQRLDFCIAQFNAGNWRIPDVIAFEYGGIEMLKEVCGSDRDVMVAQIPRLRSLAATIRG